MTLPERMRDAAFPENIPGSWDGAVGGYYGGPRAFNVWAPGNWARFGKHKKLPIWVAGFNGHDEARTAVLALRGLGVPEGVWTAVDMETRVDKTYLQHFGAVFDRAGYKWVVYGSASTVFGNPAPHGYWVADYRHIGPFMYDSPVGTDVRMTQYASNDNWDSSTVKDYTWEKSAWWV